MSTCLAELSSDVRRCGESHARVGRCIYVFVRAWSWHNQLIIDCNVFRRWDKINSNVTNDIEVISSLSSDLSSVCLPNCFIFLQTGRAFWFWPMLAGAPKLLWPLLMKAQSTKAHRRCCEWDEEEIECLLIYESKEVNEFFIKLTASFTTLGSNGSSQKADVDESDEHLQHRRASTGNRTKKN